MAIKADDIWDLWIVVPSHLETERRNWSHYSTLGLEGWRKQGLGCLELEPCGSEKVLNEFSVVLRASCPCAPAFRNEKELVFTISRKWSNAAHIEPMNQSLLGSMFAVWGLAEAVTGISMEQHVHSDAALVVWHGGCWPGPVLSFPPESWPHLDSAAVCKQHGEFR